MPCDTLVNCPLIGLGQGPLVGTHLRGHYHIHHHGICAILWSYCLSTHVPDTLGTNPQPGKSPWNHFTGIICLFRRLFCELWSRFTDSWIRSYKACTKENLALIKTLQIQIFLILKFEKKEVEKLPPEIKIRTKFYRHWPGGDRFGSCSRFVKCDADRIVVFASLSMFTFATKSLTRGSEHVGMPTIWSKWPPLGAHLL